MASTVLSDVNFQSEIFKDTVAGEFTTRLGLLDGLMMEAPDSLISPDTTGYTVAIPKFQALSGDSVQITSSTSTTINNVPDYKDVGVWVEREKAWGVDQALKFIAGKDATRAVAQMVAGYLARETQRIKTKVLAGVFASALASSHSSGDSGTTINFAGIMDAKNKLGDNDDFLSSIVMHSKVKNDAVKNKVAEAVDTAGPQTYDSGNLIRIAGMGVYVTDALAAVAGVYSSYLGQKGSLIYKFRNRQDNQLNNANIVRLGNMATLELNRESKTAGGQDELILRFSLLVHVPGVKWDTTSVASNPTDAQLATGSNWAKVANDDKLIKLVEYKSA